MATVADLSGNNGTVDTAISLTDAQLTALATKLDTLNTSVGSVNSSVNSVYPVGATPLTNASGNVANAEAVATLAGAAGKTTYVTGLSITGSGATLGSIVLATLAGIISGTQTYPYAVAAGVLVGNQSFGLAFDPPIPASAANTAIVLTLPALGGGNTNAAVNLTGYRL